MPQSNACCHTEYKHHGDDGKCNSWASTDSWARFQCYQWAPCRHCCSNWLPGSTQHRASGPIDWLLSAWRRHLRQDRIYMTLDFRVIPCIFDIAIDLRGYMGCRNSLGALPDYSHHRTQWRCCSRTHHRRIRHTLNLQVKWDPLLFSWAGF